MLAAAAACGGGTGGGPSGVARADLLALGRDTASPPPTVTVRTLSNKTLNTVRIEHADSTLFLELQFPPHTVLHANGAAVCDSCLYTVSISVSPGEYAFTISPSDLVFRLSSTPVVTVQYGTYGDLSVYSQSSRYASPSDFDQALALWFQRSPGAWVEERNSTHAGPGVITSGIDAPGAHLIAALK